MRKPLPQHDRVPAPLPPDWRHRAVETHLAALREWGDFGFDPEDWLRELASQRANQTATRPPGQEDHGDQLDFRGLYLAYGLLIGSDAAYRTLYRLHVPGLQKAARRAGYRRSLVEEEWQALVVRLPAMAGRSPLRAYKGRGSLGGYLRIILLRSLGRQAALESAQVPMRNRLLPSTAARVLEAERLRLARDLVGLAMKKMERRERLLLHFHHADGLPLTRATVRARLLPEDQPHLRTAASRLHKRVLDRFRNWVFRLAKEEFDLHPESAEGLLDSALHYTDAVQEKETLHERKPLHDPERGGEE